MWSVDRTRALCGILLLVTLIFVTGRLAGASLFSNHWSYNHWQHLPLWYGLLWLLFAGGLALTFARYGDRVASVIGSRRKIIATLALLLAGLVALQFDSFLYGGGNLRVAQIGQSDHVVYRWFEYGSVIIVSWLDAVMDLFSLHYNTAAVYAWKIFSFGCTALSLIGAAKLSEALSPNRRQRLFLFVILFFGPQAILNFGFVGVEPVIVAASTWFALTVVRLHERYTVGKLALLWGIVMLALVMHHTTAFLIPAAIYVTVQRQRRDHRTPVIALIAAGMALVGIVIAAYIRADHSLEFARSLLFLSGKRPHSDFGIFSARHLGDMLQLAALVFPQIVMVVLLLMTRNRGLSNRNDLNPALLLSAGGLVTAFILDPVNGIALDFPRLAAYLFPWSFLLALLLAEDSGQKEVFSRRVTALLAAFSLALPFSYLPSYIRIAKADPYVTDYLERHDAFFRDACLAFRDAYFYRRDFDRANAWEWKLPIKSHAHLNLEGIKNLALQGEPEEALRTAYKLIAQNPYWSEARAVLATIQMQQGRYHLAKPHIDTALMLEPYRRDNLVNQYRYYRDARQFDSAFKAIEGSARLFPNDNEMRSDLMIAFYRTAHHHAADSLADVLLSADSSLPYPYAVKGYLAEARHESQAAIHLYTKFLTLHPDKADSVAINEKLRQLTERQSRQ
ncbi:MAG TPA: hypothetical protein VN285_12685 [Candidatus Deferrimicrobium sp.]|nr:hypothetical protein [Candidatus Deferrimicrobium sp.]